MLAFCKNKDSAFNRALQHASFQFQILVAEKSGSFRYPCYRSVLSPDALFFLISYCTANHSGKARYP